ncbi:hypothetical protein VD659_06005 [Herbiconiux sp. 11R-BC]|uniref:hypothetical protein n=1 Tax=Herbiconiux sp. 11R-BC TaxID=3111637 RepID=UPI003BFCC393
MPGAGKPRQTSENNEDSYRHTLWVEDEVPHRHPSATLEMIPNPYIGVFALAGSGAIREHGLVDRLTHDVDLFTNSCDMESFSTAIDGHAERL